MGITLLYHKINDRDGNFTIVLAPFFLMDNRSRGLISCENTFRVKGGTICIYLRITYKSKLCITKVILEISGKDFSESMSL